MIVRKADALRVCAICHRSLLLGERATRFLQSEDAWVDVCALCTDGAHEHGWVREGSPTTPIVSDARRRRRRLPHLSLGILDMRKAEHEPVASEPMLRRLSATEQAMVDASERFNESAFKRTVAGIAKSLGGPRVSLLPLSGTNPEVVITVAWDISWYQYRVVLGSNQPVRLAERGYEIDDLDERFKDWNATVDDSGGVVPDIPRM